MRRQLTRGLRSIVRCSSGRCSSFILRGQHSPMGDRGEFNYRFVPERKVSHRIKK